LISIDIFKRKSIISQYDFLYGGRVEWTELTELDVPDIVVDTALNIMGKRIKLAYGIEPRVFSKVKGKNKIKAYIERPFDLNIVFLKYFLNKYICDNCRYNFDLIFPYEEKDNFYIICKLLHIKPLKTLRKAYTYNPYSIVWYMIFKQWNITDINYMHKFLYLDERIANFYLNEFYYNPVDKIVTRTEQAQLDRWKALEFYCNRLMNHNGEKYMLKWLYGVSARKLISEMEWDIIISFYKYHNKLSEEVKSRLLREGLTKCSHDVITMEVKHLPEG
jgi:hypothetical protein